MTTIVLYLCPLCHEETKLVSVGVDGDYAYICLTEGCAREGLLSIKVERKKVMEE